LYIYMISFDTIDELMKVQCEYNKVVWEYDLAPLHTLRVWG